VDSNATLKGGIAPQLRVPVTEEIVAWSMNGEDVQLTYALQWLAEQHKTTNSGAKGSVPAASPKVSIPFALPVLALGLILLPTGRRDE
jgi:carboxyl-terminal processing protease